MGQILAIAFVVICIAWLVILGVCAADVVREHGPQGAPTYSFTEIDPHIRTSISPLVRLIPAGVAAVLIMAIFTKKLWRSS